MNHVLLLILSLLAVARSNLCTKFVCDSGVVDFNLTGSGIDTAYNSNSTFCGTDLEDHIADFGKYFCYAFVCNVSVLYPGTCACPNDCSNRGICFNNTCQCNAGWTGPDCLTLQRVDKKCAVCPKSDCFKDDNISFCDCPQHKTGLTCSADAKPFTVNQVYPGQYYQDDKYEDDHPVFNRSVVAITRITMNESDFISLFDPVNLFSKEYINVTFQFSNGNIYEFRENVLMRKKGFIGSRMFPKKAYKLKFNQIKGKTFKKMKALNFKAADDPTHMVDFMSVGFYRSLLVPTYRASYSALYFNNVYFGLYFMHEDLDDLFLESRFGNSDGNFYKGNVACLEYFGDNPETYMNMTAADELPFSTEIQTSYNQMEGDGNFSDLVRFIKTINLTLEGGLFETEIQKVLDVESFLRSTAINSLMSSFDDYVSNCNNFIFYNNPATGLIHWSAHDFTFSMTSFMFTVSDSWNASVFNPYHPLRERGNGTASNQTAGVPVLFYKVMNVSKFRARYVAIIQTILRDLWIPFVNSSTEIDHLEAYIAAYVADDRLGAMFLDANFSFAVATLREWIANRTNAVVNEVGLPPAHIEWIVVGSILGACVLFIGVAVGLFVVKRYIIDASKRAGYTLVDGGSNDTGSRRV